jgi:tape measure domain-containing protein
MNNNLQYTLTLRDLFSRNMNDAIRSTQTLDQRMSRLSSSVSGLGTAIAGAFSIGAITNFTNAVIEAYANHEKFHASLKVLMGDQKQYVDVIGNQLIGLAAKTPFELRDVQEGTKQLLAYGFNVGTITENLRMLGDVSSAVGAPLTEIIYLYGTLRTQGRAYSRDIMQFTGRGIPIVAELAKQFGVTESKIKQMVEEGKVGFPQVEKAFQSMTQEGGRFFGMMDEQSKTLAGTISNLGDAWDQLKVQIGEANSGILKSTVETFKDIIDYLGRSAKAGNDLVKGFETYQSNKSNLSGDISFTIGEKTKNIVDNAISSVFGWAGPEYGTGMIANLKGKQDEIQRNIGALGNLKGADLTSKTMVLQQNLQNKLKDLESGYAKGGMLSQVENPSLFSGTPKMEEKEYHRLRSMYQAGIEQTKGILDIEKKRLDELLKPASISDEDKKDKKKKEKTDTTPLTKDYYGSKPQNIIINLDRLGDIKIETTNIQESADKAKDIFTKQLLEVLNDANLMANR